MAQKLRFSSLVYQKEHKRRFKTPTTYRLQRLRVIMIWSGMGMASYGMIKYGVL